MVKQKQKTKKMRIPRSVQEAVPISTVYDDGLFVVDKNLYSQTYRFTDINYAVASYDDKMDMLKGYMALINSFDASASTKITVNNRRLNRKDFERDILQIGRASCRERESA